MEKSSIEENILKKFLYNEKLRYNEIWDKKLCSSSKFDYYLKKLISDKVIEKKEEFYILTSAGLDFISKIDGISLKNKEKPFVCSFVVFRNEEGKVLLQKRLKQPYINYYNIPGGKVDLGESSKQCAIREIEEETGLKCLNSKLKVIAEIITNNNISKETENHLIGYFYFCDKFEGKLLEKAREGENEWFDFEEIKSLKILPNVEYIVEKCLNSKNIVSIKSTRLKENGKFVDMKIEENE